MKFETINGQLCRMVEPEPPREPEYVICKRCGGSQSAPNPAVSNTAYTTCSKCGGTGYEIKEQKPDDLYLNIKPSNPADWCFDKKNLLVLVDDNFKGIVGENVTREQVGEIAKLLTEPAKEQFAVGDWVEFRDIEGIKHGIIEGRREEYSVLCNGVSQSVGDKFITRKLNPSEIVLDFGNGIRGTIRRYRGEQIRIYDGDINFACLAISYVTEPMQTTVRKLLAAIEEERKKQ